MRVSVRRQCHDLQRVAVPFGQQRQVITAVIQKMMELNSCAHDESYIRHGSKLDMAVCSYKTIRKMYVILRRDEMTSKWFMVVPTTAPDMLRLSRCAHLLLLYVAVSFSGLVRSSLGCFCCF